MRKFNNPLLQDVMEQINNGLANLTEQIKQATNTDAYLFIQTFRDELWKRGVERDHANSIAARFDLTLYDGVLDKEDIVGAAEQYAEWVVEMINTIQVSCPDDDLLNKVYEEFDLSLKV